MHATCDARDDYDVFNLLMCTDQNNASATSPTGCVATTDAAGASRRRRHANAMTLLTNCRPRLRGVRTSCRTGVHYFGTHAAPTPWFRTLPSRRGAWASRFGLSLSLTPQ
jgi:hypothetical protein